MFWSHSYFSHFINSQRPWHTIITSSEIRKCRHFILYKGFVGGIYTYICVCMLEALPQALSIMKLLWNSLDVTTRAGSHNIHSFIEWQISHYYSLTTIRLWRVPEIATAASPVKESNNIEHFSSQGVCGWLDFNTFSSLCCKLFILSGTLRNIKCQCLWTTTMSVTTNWYDINVKSSCRLSVAAHYGLNNVLGIAIFFSF